MKLDENELNEWNKFVDEIIEECDGYYEDCFFSYGLGEWTFNWGGGNTSYLSNEEYDLLRELLDKRKIPYNIH